MAAAAAWSVMARVELFGQALYYYGSDLLGMGWEDLSQSLGTGNIYF